MTQAPPIKCIVWDLDGTLWDGVLLEDDQVTLRSGVVKVLETLDQRGILHSIASKNDPDLALAQLRRLGVAEYFVHPEIGWNAKSISIGTIRDRLNIALESILFLDDEAYERDEVASEHPEVLCWDASVLPTLLEEPRLNPTVVSPDARKRRLLYRAQMQRTQAEESFVGPRSEFLASLQMHFTIARATEDDLARAEELTVRTHQLNTTGRTYDVEELNALRTSPDHEVLICELEDKYGHHGKVGLALVQLGPHEHHLRLLLMSCRVMTLGVGSLLLGHVMRQARQHACTLKADFRKTSRNRPMYITFKMAGFQELPSVPTADGTVVLQSDLSFIPRFPRHIRLSLPETEEPSTYGPENIDSRIRAEQPGRVG